MQLIGGGTDIPQRVVQFDMKMSNAVELQNQVAHRLRDELGGTTGFLRKEIEKIAWSRNGSEITEYDYYVRGQTFSLRESPDWPRTYEQLTEGLARYPDSVLLRCKLALYYTYSDVSTHSYSGSVSTESEKLFEQASSLNKKSRLDEWYYHWVAAEVNSGLGHHRTAVNEAKATIAMAPYDTLSHNILAKVLTRAHLYDEALEWFKIAATDPNPKRWYFDDLVKGFAAAQTWPEAVTFANVQIASNPPAIKWWYDFLGTAYMRSGQSDKAKEAWKKLAELPDPPQ
jgi:tetratricopeptide (TPR) repeat protein